MAFVKEIKGDELYLWQNGKLIYKKWLNTGASKVFDKMAYGKYTDTSITDLEINNTDNLIVVRAYLKIYTTQVGGRKTPIFSGYRPNHVFEYGSDGPLGTYIGDINFDDREMFHPGEEGEVIVRFVFHMPIEKYIHIGAKWWIHEGLNKIGEAEILEVVETK